MPATNLASTRGWWRGGLRCRPSNMPRAQRERWRMNGVTRSGTAVKLSAQGSYCTSPRESISVHVSTMSSPIASGQPPTARRSSVQ
jgi:hypothetical protein